MEYKTIADLKAGDRISFENDSFVYEISNDYKKGIDIIKKCSKNCLFDHDHYEEDYIIVKSIQRIGFPISKVKTVFDPITHIGTPIKK